MGTTNETERQLQLPFPLAEWKLITLRELALHTERPYYSDPKDAVNYWMAHVVKNLYFNPDYECLVVLVLDSHGRFRGHYIVATGLIDEVCCHPREVFRIAILAAAHSVIVMHNHPSGDPTPSVGDISQTKRLKGAGEIIGIKVLDHIIVGDQLHLSMEEDGVL